MQPSSLQPQWNQFPVHSWQPLPPVGGIFPSHSGNSQQHVQTGIRGCPQIPQKKPLVAPLTDFKMHNKRRQTDFVLKVSSVRQRVFSMLTLIYVFLLKGLLFPLEFEKNFETSICLGLKYF